MSMPDRQDAVFKALASPMRRALLDQLRDLPMTTGSLCALFAELDRCSVMQHLKVLEAADLVIVERRGRERWNHLNVVPIQEVHDRWIGPMAAHAASGLHRLKQKLENSEPAREEA